MGENFSHRPLAGDIAQLVVSLARVKRWVWWCEPVVLAVVKWIRRSGSYLAMQDVRDPVSQKTHRPLSIVKVVRYKQL